MKTRSLAMGVTALLAVSCANGSLPPPTTSDSSPTSVRAVLMYDPLRLVVDIGGDPDAIAPNIAVYSPAFGARATSPLTISGLVRAFEAHQDHRDAPITLRT